MEGILGDNRVSKRRGVRLTVNWLDRTKKNKRAFIIITIIVIIIIIIIVITYEVCKESIKKNIKRFVNEKGRDGEKRLEGVKKKGDAE